LGFDKAASGIPPDPKTDIPEFLTPKKTLEIVELIMKSSSKKI